MDDFQWPGTRWAVRSFAQLAVRPWLWRYTLRFVVWTPVPHVPMTYVKFRLTTMYGHSKPEDPMDLVRFLEWVRRFPAMDAREGLSPS